MENADRLYLVVRDNSLNYWVEASGAIEHYFKKHKGYPIPNEYAVEILGKRGVDIVLKEDSIHYTRTLEVDGDPLTKMIFGFKNKDTYDKVVQDLEGYMQFRDRVLSEAIYHKQDAMDVIDSIFDLNELGIYEIPPRMYEYLKYAYDYFKRVNYNIYRDRAEALLYSVTPLTLEEF